MKRVDGQQTTWDRGWADMQEMAKVASKGGDHAERRLGYYRSGANASNVLHCPSS